MLLLTGATGLVGSALLRRLVAEGTEVRCLVRDPRRLGAQRVRVQIALGDLADPPSFRNALRGVDTVVHLAASIRDQPRGSIEELNGIATWRMVRRPSARARSASCSSPRSAPARRTARACCAPRRSPSRPCARRSCTAIVFAPSIIYAPGDPWLTLLARLALLPVMPVSGRGRAVYQPIWAEDVADCVLAALRAATASPTGATSWPGRETLSHDDIVRSVLRSLNRSRPLVHVPTPVVSRTLRLLEALLGQRAFATWDEAELMEVPMISAAGTADARRLGVSPQRWPRCSPTALAPEALVRRAARAPRASGARPTGRPLPAARRARAGWPRPAGRPTSCTPVGSPSSPVYSGSEMAGSPIALMTGVNGVNRPERVNVCIGSGAAVSSVPSGSGRWASAGVSSAS